MISTIKLMFMNEIKSLAAVSISDVVIPFTYIFVNWNSYQIKALITLDYLLFFFVSLKCVFRQKTAGAERNETH